MKTIAGLLLVSVFLFGLMGCTQEVETGQVPEISLTEMAGITATVPEFSYEEVKNRFGEGTPGVKISGFRNVASTPIRNETDAVERAKTECTVEYDTVRVRYDNAADVWEICFFANHPGGGQDVYLNGEGVTQLIVYGE